ncbi:MAG: transketolase [Spirochaetia bacterium]|jgi:transketolase
MITTEEKDKLQSIATEARKLTIDAIGRVGIGHIGGSLSMIDILTLLYFRHMYIDPEQPAMKDRDIFILSKGHSGPGLYAVLTLRGYFPKEWLQTLNQGGTNLPSHCDMNRTPGIDMTTGSLGQGLSAAVGMALANRMDNIARKVYLLLGDGENHEGQVWEAAMCASHYRLNNIIAFVDFNKMTVDGYIHEIMNIDDLSSKWNAFGWFVLRVNGHDFDEMDAALERAKKEMYRPSVIILDTKKAKGAFFAEGKVGSHNMAFDYETAKRAIDRLNNKG